MELSALVTAVPGDRDALIALIKRAVVRLNEMGIPQWDERYPCASDVDEDIQKKELFVVRADGRIAGMITLNRESDPDYANGKWHYQGPEYMVVHRLIVCPSAQGQGVGTRMMRMAEAMLRERGIQSVRLDAFAQNPYSLRLYDKLGYRIAGEAVWRMGLFYLMEKNITVED